MENIKFPVYGSDETISNQLVQAIGNNPSVKMLSVQQHLQ